MSFPRHDLTGRVALVTGGGGGIGSCVCRRLAEAGAKVAVNDTNAGAVDRVVAEITQAGGIARSGIADITDTDAVNAMVAGIAADWGGVDILVNNAGFVRDRRVQKMSDEEWDSVVDLCLKAQFLCARAVVPAMVEKRHGRIVNISSMAYRGNVGQANYAAAKAGVIGLTTALGLELAGRGITVNCIAPGLIATPNLATFPQDVVDRLVASIPVGRTGQPDDIANAVLFFASDASGFVTRQVLHVSGGNEGF